MTNPPKLLDQVRDKLRVKHYSIRTEQTYVDWIKRFIFFHGKRHPKDMGAQDVEAFLTHFWWLQSNLSKVEEVGRRE